MVEIFNSESRRPINEEFIPMADSPDQVRPWEEIVLTQSNHLARGLLRNFHNLGFRRLPSHNILERRGREYEILRDFRNLDSRLLNSIEEQHISPSYRVEKARYYQTLANEVKKRDRWQILRDLHSVLYGILRLESIRESELDVRDVEVGGQIYIDLLKVDLHTLYLLTRNRGRLLIGTSDGYVFKDVEVPGEKRSNWWEVPVFYVSENYLPFLSEVGRRQSVATPTRLIHPHAIPSLEIPQPAKTPEELIEDAYFRQRYIVPPEGAEVRFRHAGDLVGATMVQTGDLLYTKVLTTQGELLTRFDLASCASMGSDSYDQNDPRLSRYIHLSEECFRQAELYNIPVENFGIPTKLTAIIAEVYHDLVTAEEIEGGIPRILKTPRTQTLEKREEELAPQVTYIPRVIRKGQKPEVRGHYEGQSRPIRPHKVKAHRRQRGLGITPKHEEVVRNFEQKYGLRILENLPAGYTFVRPFFVPREAEIGFADLPQFIKRRIET